MSSRVFDRGRVLYASPDYAQYKPMPRSLDRGGNPIDQAPIPMDSAGSPQRQGIPYRDPEDGLVYRIIDRLNIQEGWGTAGFWMKRYTVAWDVIVLWVERGWLEAAMERGSPTKRYRCRDERKLLEYLGVHPDLVHSTKKPKKSSKKPSPSRT
jgi:hypothetical protein